MTVQIWKSYSHWRADTCFTTRQCSVKKRKDHTTPYCTDTIRHWRVSKTPANAMELDGARTPLLETSRSWRGKGWMWRDVWCTALGSSRKLERKSTLSVTVTE
ncbi:hypothetical protein Droror1_Dr00022277 [Drosera rotundifolia]